LYLVYQEKSPLTYNHVGICVMYSKVIHLATDSDINWVYILYQDKEKHPI